MAIEGKLKSTDGSILYPETSINKVVGLADRLATLEDAKASLDTVTSSVDTLSSSVSTLTTKVNNTRTLVNSTLTEIEGDARYLKVADFNNTNFTLDLSNANFMTAAEVTAAFNAAEARLNEE